ncbi:MAG: hypothetical protein ACYDCK_15255 [Thermoplasmatota archaeon]
MTHLGVAANTAAWISAWLAAIDALDLSPTKTAAVIVLLIAFPLKLLAHLAEQDSATRRPYVPVTGTIPRHR